MNDFFHIGILTNNLEAAIEEWSVHRGVAFRFPIVLTSREIEQKSGIDDGPSLRITYSVRGPFYIELIEATGSGLWGPQNIGGVHHIGMWCNDPLTESNRLEQIGHVREATIFGAPDLVSAVMMRTPSGQLVELVNTMMNEPLLAWLRGDTDHILVSI